MFQGTSFQPGITDDHNKAALQSPTEVIHHDCYDVWRGVGTDQPSLQQQAEEEHSEDHDGRHNVTMSDFWLLPTLLPDLAQWSEPMND